MGTLGPLNNLAVQGPPKLHKQRPAGARVDARVLGFVQGLQLLLTLPVLYPDAVWAACLASKTVDLIVFSHALDVYRCLSLPPWAEKACILYCT